jgi:thiol-disulfide isomerase/thioredoxin
MPRKWSVLGSFAVAMAMVAPAFAQDTKVDAPADKPTEEKSADEKTAVDPYIVPDGSPQELKGYIQHIIRNIPQDKDTNKKARAAMLKAAEKIIAAEKNRDELDFAVDVKMRSLDTPDGIKAFREELEKAGHGKQAKAVQGYLLQIGLRESIMSGKLDLQKQQIEAVLKYLQEDTPQQADLSMAIMAGQIAEFQNDSAYAIDIYKKLSSIFNKSKDSQLAEFSKRLEGTARRLGLMGQAMKLEGNLLSGETFDFSKYLGKVVLVDFWATWCGPCVQELPNLKKYYELYHNKGFEIISISCDQNREDLEKFIKEKDIPWANVYGEKGPSPTVEYYGILGIPTMVLIDKDGKVINLQARGEELGKMLEKLLGPSEEKKDPK